MQIIIVGQNRVEFCPIKKKDNEKRFFATRGQLYKVVPDQLIRFRQYDLKGKELPSDEVIIFVENSTVPYHVINNVSYFMDDVLADIDIQKGLNSNGIFKKNIFFSKAKSIWAAILPFMGAIIMGAIVLWAFVS